MKILIFEDEKYEDLYPLTYTRPVFELRCGYFSLRERIVKVLSPEKVYCFTREYLCPLFKRKTGISFNNWEECLEDIANPEESLLLINGRWLMKKAEAPSGEEEEIGVCEGNIVYARLKKRTLQSLSNREPVGILREIRGKVREKEIKATLINYLWDLVYENGEIMREDFNLAGNKGIKGEFSSLSTVYGDKEAVYVAPTAQVHPMVVLDTSGGPIYIDEEAIIFPHSRLEGPCYIGKGTHIVGAKVREGTSLGPVCRVGDEIEETIIHGYTNKFHNGFLGHAYVGEWVNLGAATNNSDLKNTYGVVKVYVKGELMNTGKLKVGCFIGDHSKLGIGTLINTGSVIGVSVNYFGGGVTPKFIPSFAWGTKEGFVVNQLDKVLKQAGVVMERRDVEITEEDKEVLRKVFELTKEEREKFQIKEG